MDFHDKLEIRLSGNIDSEVLGSIKKHPYLNNKVSELGYLTHKQVLKEYNNATILLLLIFNSNSGKGNYPGKIFEYFAAKRSIIAFGPKESDSKKLIENTSTGFYYDYDSIDNLEKDIKKIFKNPLEFKFSDKINRFNRRTLTKKLSNLLNRL